MTVPLAAVLRLIAGVRERDRVVLIGFLLSLSIEVIQLLLLIFAHSNRWADSNDLIANTLGAWLGWLVLRRLLRRPAVANAFDRWTLAPQPEPSPRS
jgi:glycopeptide antibiotics resistance protein